MTKKLKELTLFISLKLFEACYNFRAFFNRSRVRTVLNSLVFVMLAAIWGLVIHLIINELIPILGANSFREFISGFWELLKRERLKAVIGLSGALLVTFTSPLVAICSTIFFCLKRDLKSCIGCMFSTFAVALTYVTSVIASVTIAIAAFLLLLYFFLLYKFLHG